MRGVILAGGYGTRLRPLTLVTNKHLLPVYDKPMIMYPLDTLISLGIKDILIVSGGEHIGKFIELLGDGSRFGITLTFKVQESAGGIADALSRAKDFSHGEPLAVILGDNVFGIDNILEKLSPTQEVDGYTEPYSNLFSLESAAIVIKKVEGASRFGVLMGETWEDEGKNHYEIVEKPAGVETGDAVTGLYFYPPEVFEVIESLTPSARGELEITDVNNYFIRKNICRICRLGDDDFWSDAGTFESLLTSANWVRMRSSLDK